MVKQSKAYSGARPKVMNIKEVADYLGVHTSTIYKHAQRGAIPAFKIGSDWRFSEQHINRWIDEKMKRDRKSVV